MMPVAKPPIGASTVPAAWAFVKQAVIVGGVVVPSISADSEGLLIVAVERRQR